MYLKQRNANQYVALSWGRVCRGANKTSEGIALLTPHLAIREERKKEKKGKSIKPCEYHKCE